MELISVIVPVYNTGMYLEQCINSIRNQTYENLEIILIDDGSIDNSKDICDKYAGIDSRIVVIHKNNGGLVSSKKEGLKAAHGKYVGFVDSDDWIDEEMYEKLYGLMREFRCDMVASGLFRQYGDKAVLVCNTISEGIYDKEKINEKIIPYMLYNGVYYQMGIRPNLVNKLFVRDKIKDVQMLVPDIISNGDDTATTYGYIVKAEKIYLTNQSYYHYRQHDGSISKSLPDPKELERMRALYYFMAKQFNACSAKESLMFQLNYYISNMLVQRCSNIYDRGKTLSIFGGIEKNASVVVYGAGNFGKQIFNILVSEGFHTTWVDKNFAFYEEKGLPVKPIEIIRDMQMDYVLIAIIDEEIANNVKRLLDEMGLPDSKIRWLALEYITSGRVLEDMGFFYKEI